VPYLSGQATTIPVWTTLSPEMTVARYYPTVVRG